jgi:hypothetical protein
MSPSVRSLVLAPIFLLNFRRIVSSVSQNRKKGEQYSKFEWPPHQVVLRDEIPMEVNNFPGFRLSRDAYKRAKELEEARKAGTAPAAVDEDGKEINPHIPQYIADAPWYLSKDTPSLKHQKSAIAKIEADKDWYERGVKAVH